MLASHPSIAAITDAPVPENEGCYLQGAIPHTALHGRPGHYALDPEQHLVEECRYDTLATRRRMEADWDRWFEGEGHWRVEKSPVNLIRMRLYQQLFPTAQFVVILRHPAVMAAALAKWIDVEPGRLIEYALDAYDLVFDDLRYLHSALVIRYEDLATGDAFPAVLSFLDLEPADQPLILRDGNAEYQDIPAMDHHQIERARQLGYGDEAAVWPFNSVVRHPLRETRERTRSLLDRANG